MSKQEEYLRKPDWLKIKLNTSDSYKKLKSLMREKKLNTVCEKAMDDLLAHDVDSMTIGQYLQPTKKHLKVERYYHPDEFKELEEIALAKGFKHCKSGPLVRSSYHADEQVSSTAAQRRIQYMRGYEEKQVNEIDFSLKDLLNAED